MTALVGDGGLPAGVGCISVPPCTLFDNIEDLQVMSVLRLEPKKYDCRSHHIILSEKPNIALEAEDEYARIQKGDDEWQGWRHE